MTAQKTKKNCNIHVKREKQSIKVLKHQFVPFLWIAIKNYWESMAETECGIKIVSNATLFDSIDDESGNKIMLMFNFNGFI